MRALVLVMLLETVASADPVRGSVVDDAGKPIANATVTACSNSPELLGSLYIVQHAAGVTKAIAESKRLGYGECHQTTTDANGGWKLDVGLGVSSGALIVAPGRALVVEPIGDKYKGAVIATVMDPEAPAILDMTCTGCGQITLHFGYHGWPDHFSKTQLWTQLDKPGRIPMLGLHRGAIQFHAYSSWARAGERDGTVEATLGSSPVVIKLPVVATGTNKSISGRITYTGDQIGSVQLECGPGRERVRNVTRKPGGDFVIEDVPPGPCRFTVLVHDATNCTKDLPVVQPGATNVKIEICAKRPPPPIP